MVLGPGLIVMVADNDAGAVGTYVQAGAQYGRHLLWLLPVLLPITYFVQEMVARLGIVTGQGHAATIYKRFGKVWGVFSLVDLLLVNFLTLVTEFALIALSLGQLGVSPYVAVPIAAVGLMALVLTSSYRRWERVVFFLCAFDLMWFAMAYLMAPSAGEVLRSAVIPSLPVGGLSVGLMFLIVAIVGTTIAPWQLFFQQSCVADKKLRFADLKYERFDTLIGAFIVIIVAGCMMLAGDYARRRGIPFSDPGQMAHALARYIGGPGSSILLLLMANAAVLGTTAISLSSAWAYGEVKGWPHSLQMSVREAPGFYLVYVLCVAAAAGFVLIPHVPLQLVILSVQVLAGIMLPPMIILIQVLCNDKELLGDKYVNRPWRNWVNWTIVAVLFAMSLVLAAQVVAPGLFPAT
jgi:Mn2+/Fe2+ NRAMP family transporter